MPIQVLVQIGNICLRSSIHAQDSYWSINELNAQICCIAVLTLRDTTVQTLTLQPSVQGGVVTYQDSPLV